MSLIWRIVQENTGERGPNGVVSVLIWPIYGRQAKLRDRVADRIQNQDNSTCSITHKRAQAEI